MFWLEGTRIGVWKFSRGDGRCFRFFFFKEIDFWEGEIDIVGKDGKG